MHTFTINGARIKPKTTHIRFTLFLQNSKKITYKRGSRSGLCLELNPTGDEGACSRLYRVPFYIGPIRGALVKKGVNSFASLNPYLRVVWNLLQFNLN